MKTVKNRPSIKFRPDEKMFARISKFATSENISMNLYMNRAMAEYFKLKEVNPAQNH